VIVTNRGEPSFVQTVQTLELLFEALFPAVECHRSAQSCGLVI